MPAGPIRHADTLTMPPDHGPPPPLWHTLDAEAVAAALQTDPGNGLPEATVRERQAQFGPNAIREGPRRSKLRMLLSQFTDFMILLLIAAAVVSGVIGDAADTAIILGIVVLNGAVGFVQEFRAERAMAALKRLAAFDATVVRDGQRRTVKADALVPGDIVLLQAGNAVPADLRLLEAIDLRLGEAALTGESLPITKDTAALPDPALGVADRANMAFKGTVVMHGRGRGIVVATGMVTELGRIASMLEAVGETRTPLQQRLGRFGRQIAIVALAVCGI